MAMENLIRMLVFARVVDANSFSGAAQRLQLGKSAVSRHVQLLEQTLGMRLLNRTTRSLTLTDEGRLVYEHCARIAEELESLESSVSRLRSEPTGTLRVGTSVAFGTLHLTRLALEFMQRYPKVKVQLALNDRYSNLAEEGLDLAIRLGMSSDTNVVAKRICGIDYALCAAPAYLAQQGRPASPKDLAGHNCLFYSHVGDEAQWSFQRDGAVEAVTVRGTFVATSSIALKEAAMAGIGIALLPTFVAGPELAAGGLERLLPAYLPSGNFGQAIYAVYFQNKYLSPKVRAFIEFLVDRLGPKPYWDAYQDSPSASQAAINF